MPQFRFVTHLLILAAFSSLVGRGQQTVTLAPTGFQMGADVWAAPPGTQLSMDRRTGRLSMALPTQPSDGSREQMVRYEEWRLHPYPGTGPFPATREEPASLMTHTIYRPSAMAKAPKLPVILWANGGCRNTSVEFTRFLGEIASHGYLVIAVGRSDVPFMVTGAGTKPIDARPLTVDDPTYLAKGLDWAVAENKRPGSPLFGKVEVSRVATLGQSCGGSQAFRAAKDPRVTTVVVLNASFPTKNGTGFASRNADAEWTAEKLTIPSASFGGGPADSAYSNAEAGYKAIPPNVPALKAGMLALGHTGAYPMPDVRWCKAVIAWLDWTLRGQKEASRVFSGANCEICSDPDWWVDSHDIP